MCPDPAELHFCDFHYIMVPIPLRQKVTVPVPQHCWLNSYFSEEKWGRQCCGPGMFNRIFPSRIGVFPFRIPDPNFNPKKWFLSSRKYGLGLFIPDPDPDFGSRGQNGTGSRIRNTATLVEEHPPMTRVLSGQSMNFSLKSTLSMLELIRPSTVHSGLQHQLSESTS